MFYVNIGASFSFLIEFGTKHFTEADINTLHAVRDLIRELQFMQSDGLDGRWVFFFTSCLHKENVEKQSVGGEKAKLTVNQEPYTQQTT